MSSDSRWMDRNVETRIRDLQRKVEEQEAEIRRLKSRLNMAEAAEDEATEFWDE